LSVRKIDNLINNLSLSSSLARKYMHDWGWQEELLATLIEVVDVGNIQALAVGGVKKYDLPKQIKLPRPGAKEKRQATAQETAEIFKANLRVIEGGGES
jgi:hypothetical protein